MYFPAGMERWLWAAAIVFLQWDSYRQLHLSDIYRYNTI